jgi:hypothetical protein
MTLSYVFSFLVNRHIARVRSPAGGREKITPTILRGCWSLCRKQAVNTRLVATHVYGFANTWLCARRTTDCRWLCLKKLFAEKEGSCAWSSKMREAVRSFLVSGCWVRSREDRERHRLLPDMSTSMVETPRRLRLPEYLAI